MMEFVHVAVAVFSLLSFGCSAPVTSCENLIQSFEIQRNQLLGKWIQIAGSTDIPRSNMLTKIHVDNAWLNTTATNETDTFNNFQIQKNLGMCVTAKTNFTVVNNTLTVVHPYQYSGVLLNTGCPDCLVIYSNIHLRRTTANALQLMSRRVKVSAAELEEFTKQAVCLNLPSPAIFDSEKGFCPDPALDPETKTIEQVLSRLNSDGLNLLEKLFSSKNGNKTILDMFQNSVALFKQD